VKRLGGPSGCPLRHFTVGSRLVARVSCLLHLLQNAVQVPGLRWVSGVGAYAEAARAVRIPTGRWTDGDALASRREGIVSKRLSAPYRSGLSREWIKVKNPNSPAMVRHREERW
jgi:hypothetical protein